MSGRGEGSEEDALWRSIVANYGERAVLEPDEELPVRRPSESAERAEGESPSTAATPVPPEDPHGPPAADPWVERHLAEEHFTPPEPPPLTRPEPRRLLAWLGVLGVPVVVILAAIFGVPVPSWGTLVLVVWFVGGFGYLVATMRQDDDDRDDGAVV